MSTVLASRPPATPLGLLANLRRLYARRETIRFLTISALKAGHRDKVLGHLWSVLDPLLFMLVYYFVFAVLFPMISGARPVDFMLYMLIGIIVFRFIDATVSQSSTTIRANRGLIHEVNFPKAVFPISLTLSRLYDFLWGLLVLLVFLFAANIWPTIHYLWIPLLLLLTILFAMGAAMLVAYLGAFFADTSNVVSIGMRLLFYLSPVFYFVRSRSGHSAAIHDETIRRLYFVNPMADLMECWRDALLWGVVPDWRLLAYVALFTCALAITGFAIFTNGERRFAKYV